jgi:hypothetical protein
MSQARFQKQQREKARREKAAAKWARRVERREAANAADDVVTQPADEAKVLTELAELHERFDAGAITFDEFTDAKDALIGRLDV